MKVNLLKETEETLKKNNLRWEDITMITCQAEDNLNNERYYVIDVENFKEVAKDSNYDNTEFIDQIAYDIKIFFKNGNYLRRKGSARTPAGWEYVISMNNKKKVPLHISRLLAWDDEEDFFKVIDLN